MDNNLPLQETNIPPCPFCGAALVEKKGVSRKSGLPYHFWSCPNYPDCKYTWRPVSKQNKQHEEIMKEFKSIHERLDKLAIFLNERLK